MTRFDHQIKMCKKIRENGSPSLLYTTLILSALLSAPNSRATPGHWDATVAHFASCPRVLVHIAPTSLQSLDHALAQKEIGKVMTSDLKPEFILSTKTMADGKTARLIEARSADATADSEINDITPSANGEIRIEMTMDLMTFLKEAISSPDVEGISLTSGDKQSIVLKADIERLSDPLLSLDIFENQQHKLNMIATTGAQTQTTPMAARTSPTLQTHQPFTGESSPGVSLRLESFGNKKIAVIKALRTLTGYGLLQTKNLCEAAPVLIAENLSEDQALQWVEVLDQVGASVTRKQ